MMINFIDEDDVIYLIFIILYCRLVNKNSKFNNTIK